MPSAWIEVILQISRTFFFNDDLELIRNQNEIVSDIFLRTRLCLNNERNLQISEDTFLGQHLPFYVE